MIASVWIATYECLQMNLRRTKCDIIKCRVISEISMRAQNQSQSSVRSLVRPFKQVLDGYKIDFGHIILLAGDRG